MLAHLSEWPPGQLAAAPGAALAAAVERAEAEIVPRLAAAGCNAGSTLLAALLLDGALHVANVGDCRAVLARGPEAVQITTDHKPGDEAEGARIARDHVRGRSPGKPAAAAEAAADGNGDSGGPPDAARCRDQGRRGRGRAAPATVAADGSGASPLVSADGYLYGELAVARALGSQHLKRDPTKAGFTHTPDIFTVQLVREDDALILASDGLWDGVDNAEAVGAARRCLARGSGGAGGADAAARALVDRAVRRGSTDNISVVVVALHARGVALPKTNSMLFRRLGSGGSAGSGSLQRDDSGSGALGATCSGGTHGPLSAAAGVATPGGSACATPAGGSSRSGTPPPPPPTPPPHAS
jgi:serine/threonine protein phosphatase PrpC